ncbi:hypothetical protein C5749_08550 [Sphingobacterium gobiense]|uniref:Uncharacterized protein n=1 Tax=Sphingobacterium gobiense TaxID=1382456 RepID=A0A2S9JVD8_9SPHI|nr:hypothetical protein C5749_08550 [Sphingobacterium gobiense]
MKAIPYRTECCLNEVSFILFRNRQVKIAETHSALIFLLRFFIKEKMKKKTFNFFHNHNRINLTRKKKKNNIL